MLTRVLTTVAAVALIGVTASAAWSQSQPKDIRWGTPPVGTAGHKAMVTLSTLLNKEMPQYRISVLPTAGAIATVKGFATKELDGFYGSDIAFHELATDTDRFKGFKARVQRMPIQSFWSNTIEVGLAIHVRNKDKIKKWGDLTGKRVFTGPLPFDTRAQTERGLDCARREVHLCAGGSGDGRLAARIRRDRRHDDLHRLGKLAAAVAGRGFARGRLGRAQSEPR